MRRSTLIKYEIAIEALYKAYVDGLRIKEKYPGFDFYCNTGKFKKEYKVNPSFFKALETLGYVSKRNTSSRNARFRNDWLRKPNSDTVIEVVMMVRKYIRKNNFRDRPHHPLAGNPTSKDPADILLG